MYGVRTWACLVRYLANALLAHLPLCFIALRGIPQRKYSRVDLILIACPFLGGKPADLAAFEILCRKVFLVRGCLMLPQPYEKRCSLGEGVVYRYVVEESHLRVRGPILLGPVHVLAPSCYLCGWDVKNFRFQTIAILAVVYVCDFDMAGRVKISQCLYCEFTKACSCVKSCCEAGKNSCI
jgi:hypothetical protein